jgi:hypothetical protein
MRVVKQLSIVRIAVISGLLLCASFLPAARGDVLESARMLPNDTVAMISVESVQDLQAALEKTSFYSLYKDPAIQQVIAPAEKKIRAQIDTALKDFWHEAKLENPPEQIPYPEGRIVLGLSLLPRPTRSNVSITASPSAESGNEEKEEDEAEADADLPVLIQVALLADMGSRAAQARQVVQALSANIIGPNGTMQKKELAGVAMDIRMPAAGKDEPTISYGFKDNWLLVTLDETNRPDFTEAVARRIGRTLPDSLADKPGFRAATQTLGDAQIFFFVNLDAVKTLVVGQAKDKAKVESVLKGLGLTNVTSLASAVRIAGNPGQEMCAKALLGIQGAATGLPALLSPASASLKVNNRLLTRDAMGFVTANLELAQLFDDLNKIVQQAAYQDLNMIVQAMLGGTAGEGGQPPVRLRDDVLAQIGTPLLVTWKIQTPYTPASHFQFLVALPVRDGNRLDVALSRIHKALLGPDPKQRREFLDRTLYLLPMPGPDATNHLAFAVAGDHLVFGRVGDVEQAIRNLQKEPDDSLASDPVFRAAREHLPSQAGMFFYRNDRRNGEFSWAVLKDAIRGLVDKAKAEKGDASDPVGKVVKMVVESIDLSQLPDFKTVEKYWGATVGFLQKRPEGLYWETIALKPVQQ